MNRIGHYFLYASVFTLPMYIKLNNILLLGFILVGLIEFCVNFKKKDFRNFLISGWSVYLFFLLAIMGSFYKSETFLMGVKNLERYWSFLIIPLLILSNSNRYPKLIGKVMTSLALGCATTLLICYAHAIYLMVEGNEPISYLLRWRHVGHEFTEVADTHPTYLGLFIVASIIFLIQNKHFKAIYKYCLVLFLLIGLFQLGSRMALVLVILLTVGTLFVDTLGLPKGKLLLFTILGIGLCFTVYNFFGSEYMKDRFFSGEKAMNDKRFQRWEASYEIFKEAPFFGTGNSQIEERRNEKYLEYGFEQAARSDLNAHNQFLEYLSRNGIMGGFVFVLSMLFLLLFSIYKKDYLFLLIFLAFILANMTESTMVRIKGIEFYAIFASLFLTSSTRDKSEQYQITKV